jgi:hypothetical protein
MAIVLRNNTGRRLSFELLHDFVCTDDNCLCTMIEQRHSVHNAETGEVGVRTEDVKAPAAVFLSAKGTSPPLPESVLKLPAIEQHLKRGTLIREDQQQHQQSQSAVPTPVGNRGSGGFSTP